MTATLEVADMSVRFRLPGTVVRAVTGVSFTLHPGQLLALVGESGCGKSVLASALLGLLPANADVAGAAWLRGDGGEVELLGAPERILARRVRGRRIALVPQSAHAALTPTRTARAHLLETVRILEGRTGADERVGELADRTGLDRRALDLYPHELSGGMAQRVVLALALAGRSDVVLADEPTTGLDRPLADRVVAELRGLADAGLAVLMITHDLVAAERSATDLAVMYASRLLECGPLEDVLRDPWHTYTAELLDALPGRRFVAIPGHPADLTGSLDGCAFANRSARHREVCNADPTLAGAGPRRVACGLHPGTTGGH
ncbi:ABC transporter ATP-binding protein [Actinopolymorpha pittospori]